MRQSRADKSDSLPFATTKHAPREVKESRARLGCCAPRRVPLRKTIQLCSGSHHLAEVLQQLAVALRVHFVVVLGEARHVRREAAHAARDGAEACAERETGINLRPECMSLPVGTCIGT